jgi:hypothetical protein
MNDNGACNMAFQMGTSPPAAAPDRRFLAVVTSVAKLEIVQICRCAQLKQDVGVGNFK